MCVYTCKAMLPSCINKIRLQLSNKNVSIRATQAKNRNKAKPQNHIVHFVEVTKSSARTRGSAAAAGTCEAWCEAWQFSESIRAFKRKCSMQQKSMLQGAGTQQWATKVCGDMGTGTNEAHGKVANVPHSLKAHALASNSRQRKKILRHVGSVNLGYLTPQ